MKPWHVIRSAGVVSNGGVLAYPTEAVYGLGCSPYCQRAVRKILRLKRRIPGKGLILVGSEWQQFQTLVDFERIGRKAEVLASWPGPVTWIIPAKPGVPEWLSGSHRSIAIRVSAHPAVREICKMAGILVSTSANPAGLDPARNARRVRAYFGREVDFVVPGSVGGLGKPTEIRDAVTGKILRSAG